MKDKNKPLAINGERPGFVIAPTLKDRKDKIKPILNDEKNTNKKRNLTKKEKSLLADIAELKSEIKKDL